MDNKGRTSISVQRKSVDTGSVVPGAGGGSAHVRPSLDSASSAARVSTEIPRLFADVRHSIDVQLDRMRRNDNKPTVVDDPDAVRRSVLKERDEMAVEAGARFSIEGRASNALVDARLAALEALAKKKGKKALRNVAPELQHHDDDYHDGGKKGTPGLKTQETGAPQAKRPKLVTRGDKKKNKIVKQTIQMDEHKMTVEDLCRAHGAIYDAETAPDAPQGLPQDLAAARLHELGKNAITPPKKKPLIVRYVEKLLGLFNVLLAISGVISIVSIAIPPPSWSNLVLGIILIVVCFINGTTEFLQTLKSEKILEGFKQLGSKTTWVWRDGKFKQIDSTELVIGDIIKVKAGDKIPADARVLRSSGLKVDNSSLTGEGDPLLRVPEMTDENPLETKNLVFFGTMAVEGDGIAIVIRTGDNTCIGNLAKLAGAAGKTKTHLAHEIELFVRAIAAVAIITAVIFIIYGIATKSSVPVLISFAIGISTAWVPEGLPSVVVSLLSLCAKRLAKRNVICKNLESVETLGCCTVIASDKTGTLTQNRMTVVEVWVAGEIQGITYDHAFIGNPSIDTLQKLGAMAVNAAGTNPNGGAPLQVLRDSLVPKNLMDNLVHNCALCSRTFVQDEQEKIPVLKKKCEGDASEIALLKCYLAQKEQPSVEDIRAAYPKIFEIPFNSKNKWQLSVHRIPGSEDKILRMKGAPERVINKCATIMTAGGGSEPLTDSWTSKFNSAYETLAAKGERILGHAQILLPNAQYPDGYEYREETVPLDGLVFLGLTGLQDPPKVGVVDAIEKCHTAGIQVSMVTGDHPLTAKSIAKQVGIIQSEDVTDDVLHLDAPENQRCPALVIEGSKIDLLQDKDWDEIMKKKELVFARTSPQQKLLIVSKFQSHGHVVAVTGDGVNDSPALRKADLGISMGITGSEVSKEAAALILMDDNFASIVNAIEEGRLIFDNLKKSIAYTLSHSLPEVGAFIINVVLGMPLPITSIIILFIDLGTELVNGISMAYEKPEADIMRRPPRPISERLVSGTTFMYAYFLYGVLELLACMFSYLCVFAYNGIPPNMLLFSANQGFFMEGAPTLYVPGSGLIFTAAQQLELTMVAQSSYFLCLVLCQNINILNVRGKRTTMVFTGKIFSNIYVILGWIWSLALCSFICYVPGVNFILGTRGFPWYAWVAPLPWMFIMFVVEELRKLGIRRMHVPYYVKNYPTDY